MTEKTQIAFYGDDFTGSTDAMEALSSERHRDRPFYRDSGCDARLKAFNNALGVWPGGNEPQPNT